jgi:hypothetical protein
MYISAHPLDNFWFEMTHYHFTPLTEVELDQNKKNALCELQDIFLLRNI